MIKVMHKFLLEATKIAFVPTSFIIISANEVIAINNT
jgi:hypothetical protein